MDTKERERLRAVSELEQLEGESMKLFRVGMIFIAAATAAAAFAFASGLWPVGCVLLLGAILEAATNVWLARKHRGTWGRWPWRK